MTTLTLSAIIVVPVLYLMVVIAVIAMSED